MSNIESQFVGESTKNISALFSLSRKLAPTVLFIDEIDGFLGKRVGYEHHAHTTNKVRRMSSL